MNLKQNKKKINKKKKKEGKHKWKQWRKEATEALTKQILILF